MDGMRNLFSVGIVMGGAPSVFELFAFEPCSELVIPIVANHMKGPESLALYFCLTPQPFVSLNTLQRYSQG